jgi:hypothetical protein
MLQNWGSRTVSMSYFRGILQVKLCRKINTGVGPHASGRSWHVWAAMTMPLLLSWGGCASSPSPTEPAISPSADVNVNEAWRDAKMVAARAPGRLPAVGAGSSMQPVYGDNTMLVISPIDYDQLRAGMTVAYVNQRGVRVVHRLVGKVAKGWRVMGLNNDRVDDDFVTRKNLLGVIYASFNYDGGASPAK